MEEAGFRDVQEEMQIVPAPWPGRAENRWRAFAALWPGLQRRLEARSTKQRATLDQEMIAVIREDEDPEHEDPEHEQINLTSAIVVAVAHRD
jgi:hypothetical protein